MPKFSNAGLVIINQLHPDLQTVLNDVIQDYDITMLASTIRTIQEQKAFFDSGASKTMDSLHLPRPFPEFGDDKLYVCAFDCTPYPVNFDNINEHFYMAGIIMAAVEKLFKAGKIAHKVRWGGRWTSLKDYVHFELILN